MNKMNMKKIVPLALSAVLLSTISVGAQANTPNEEAVEVVLQPSFIKVSGEISTMESVGNGKLFGNGDVENPFQFSVGNDTLVFDSNGEAVNLKIGDRVTIYTYANKPMILIYPPRYSPEVVIVEKEGAMNSVKVAQFDENFLSDDGELQLNVSDETVILNVAGEKVAKEQLKNYSAIVFYGATTRSIPAQTSPTKIIVFPTLEDFFKDDQPEKDAQLEALIGTDFKMQNGTKMVPLRKVAEGLGYKVDATKTGAILSHGALSFTITRGEKAYGFNKSLQQFNQAPALLQKGKLYVEYDFARQLSENVGNE